MNGEALLVGVDVRHAPALHLLKADRHVVGVPLSSDAVSRALEAWEADSRVDFTPAPRLAAEARAPAPAPAKAAVGVFPAPIPARRSRRRLGGRLGTAAALVVLLAMTLVTAAARGTATVQPVPGRSVTVSRVVAPSTVVAPIAASAVPSVAVAPGDSLWRIAGRELGDPTRWPDIWERNRGRSLEAGSRFLNPDVIRPGWDLVLPER
ncbi:MAG: hypothetical protein WDA27_07315 [Actinomycetota bacterium]